MKAQIINRIIKEVKATSYLEIGYGNGYNFNQINCDLKIGIDPDYTKQNQSVYKSSSDEYFKEYKEDYDVIFIDGFHHADQARRDITNSLRCNPKAIILHDTLPYTKEMQVVPREQEKWTGDVWRAAVGFKKEYPDVKIETYKADYGLTVIYPEGKKVRKHFEEKELAYEDFKANEKELLNIVG